MGKVVILDENTANKIAAGEVIERPASVVKELVENSIDAGATSVIVEVKNGGITHIRVTDNGSGIDEDDAEIAFERHATSKIRNANDLDSISTLGFRGEALSSIAAVSSVDLTTRVQKNSYGININIKGGLVKEVKQVGSPVGTTFIISDLFYNTPARYKFLKKDSTEFGYISEILNRIALSNPGISIKLIGNNSTVLHTPGNNDLLSVIFSIYGKDVSKSVLPINFDDGRFKITGYVGKPEISRSTRDYQSIFINGRYIKSKIISAAVDEAYKTILMKNKYPFIVLNMELNPLLVDVNVHPTKMEVRFSEEQEVFRSVYHAVNNALLATSLVRNIELFEKSENIFKLKGKEFSRTSYTQQSINTENHFAVKEVPRDIEGLKVSNDDKLNDIQDVSVDNKLLEAEDIKDTNIMPEVKIEEYIDSDKTINDQKINNQTIIDREIKDVKEKVSEIKGLEIREGKIEDTVEEKAEETIRVEDTAKDNELKSDEKTSISIDEETIERTNEKIDEKEFDNGQKIVSAKDHPGGEGQKNTDEIEKSPVQNIFADASIIGQLFSTYILLQKDNELILIDQHAAHERVMFEHFKKKYNNRESLAQMLIAPVVIDMTFREIKLLEEKKEYLNKLGFIYENFGNNSIILRAVPDAGDSASVKELFLEVFDGMQKTSNSQANLIAEETLYTIACKSAVKANKKLDESEMRAVLKELGEIKNPYTCPHGRPVIVKLSKYEIEKMFKRIV